MILGTFAWFFKDSVPDTVPEKWLVSILNPESAALEIISHRHCFRLASAAMR